MRLRDEVQNEASCLNRALPDEFVFVLLGRDQCAPAVIRTWCELRVASGVNAADDAQIIDARAIADSMEAQRVDVIRELVRVDGTPR